MLKGYLKNPVPLILTALVLFTSIFFFSRKTENKSLPTPKANTYEYYWGDGCPHCTNVEKFLDTWSGKDKVSIDKSEVWKNPGNAKKMSGRASQCGIKPEDLGVPFLYSPDGKCLVGDTPIIDFFQSLDK